MGKKEELQLKEIGAVLGNVCLEKHKDTDDFPIRHH
jgi:hypothetical protein